MIPFLFYLYIFIFGCVIGSFLNVVIYRVPNKLSVSKGYSFCPACHHRLFPKDLVPVFSWLFLRGKCAYCGAPISARYPFVELLGGFAFLFSFNRYGISLNFIIHALLLCVIIVISFIDIDTMEIPDGSHFFILALAAGSYLINQPELSSILLGGIVIALPLFLIAWLTHGGIGGGDIKLMAASGLFLGFANTLLAGIIGIIIGGFYAACLMLIKKREGKSYMALGPFLALGISIASLYGPQIIQAYLNLFF